jgi:hypothetical protein
VAMESQGEHDPESNAPEAEAHIRSAHQILKALQEKIGEHLEICAAITKLEMGAQCSGGKNWRGAVADGAVLKTHRP